MAFGAFALLCYWGTLVLPPTRTPGGPDSLEVVRARFCSVIFLLVPFQLSWDVVPLSWESLYSNGTVIPSKLVYFSQVPTELEGQIYSLIYSHSSLHTDYKRKRKVVRGEGTSVCWVALCPVCAQPFTDVLPFSVCKRPPPHSLHSTGEQMVAPRG